MKELLRLILPAYFILFFLLVFVVRSIIVARKIGKSPVILPNDDTLYGLTGFYMKVICITMLIYTFAYGLFPQWYSCFLPIIWLENDITVYAGLAILSASLVWIFVSQGAMNKSFRIGIDENTKTELVTSGIFSISRNPIYVGLISGFVGLFLVTPNAVTLIFLLLIILLIQVQVRLEEEYLTKMHGDDFLNYKKKVRRFI